MGCSAARHGAARRGAVQCSAVQWLVALGGEVLVAGVRPVAAPVPSLGRCKTKKLSEPYLSSAWRSVPPPSARARAALPVVARRVAVAGDGALGGHRALHAAATSVAASAQHAARPAGPHDHPRQSGAAFAVSLPAATTLAAAARPAVAVIPLQCSAALAFHFRSLRLSVRLPDPPLVQLRQAGGEAGGGSRWQVEVASG